jgi:hypothetical protein
MTNHKNQHQTNGGDYVITEEELAEIEAASQTNQKSIMSVVENIYEDGTDLNDFYANLIEIRF